MSRKEKKSAERGEIMLESTIIITLTLMILVWLLALGFVHYQRYVTTVVTNDAAVKIAATYNNPTSDIIMGYVTTEDLRDRPLYRHFTDASKGKLYRDNQDRTEAYVKYMLDRTNFMGVVKNVDVEMKLVNDYMGRQHVEVVTQCAFNTPFAGLLDYFGMDEVSTYEATASAECTDMADYVAWVDYGVMWKNGSFLGGVKFISNIVGTLNTVLKAMNG